MLFKTAVSMVYAALERVKYEGMKSESRVVYVHNVIKLTV